MRHNRRPEPTTKSTSFRMPVENHDALARVATERGISLNWLINQIVQEFLDRESPKEESPWPRSTPVPSSESCGT